MGNEQRLVLRPPPGFERLALNPAADHAETTPTAEEQPSSTATIAAPCGIFPFPPPRGSPPPPPPPSPATPSSPSSGFSTWPEVSSDDSIRKMEVTNASLSSHHHEQVVALMKKKFQDLLDFAKTKNRKVLHLDWIAGNPNDPIKKSASSSATPHGGMTAEERELSDRVARAVMSVTHGVDEWDESMTWNKALFFGDWLTDEKGVRQHYLEIQIKRISGADDGLMRANGINPEYIWLPMYDATIPSITPIVVPPIVRSGMPSKFAARQLPPTPADIAAGTTVSQNPAAAQGPASLEAPASPADKGKGKAPALPEPQAGVSNPAAPVIVSSDSARPVGIALSPQAPSSLSLAGSSQTAIPRSEPMRSAGSIDSEESAENTMHANSSSGDKMHPDNETGTSQLGMEPRPVGPLKTLTKDDIIRHRKAYENKAAVKRAEMKAIFSFLRDPDFIERKKKSFVYAVRVIAIPDPGNIVNVFNGPRLQDRKGTLIAAGGWIVPPLEERVQWRDTHKRFYKHKGAKPNRYEGLPKPMVQHALPLQFDWTGRVEPRYYGPVPPVWNEPVDPTLEDVYWMVYQLLSGKQYLGFQQGTGFGVYRGEPAGNPNMLSQCPFKSPSSESLYHAASYQQDTAPGAEENCRSSQ
ncbi:hypothetical protein VTJ83DRAFT_3337 [Remersonia thermophila]|uniref:Uncharacterized protein n=1 Tax=Remersonia thermophila TaxID=72144 RepID=A0ABR4DF65_9PEZI